MAATFELPQLPAPLKDFIPYVTSKPTEKLIDIVEPYKKYDATLREIFAQQPDHPALADNNINVVPLYAGHEADVKVRARDLDAESEAEKERYLMPLKDDDRKPNGYSAVVPSFKKFKENFNLFSESALVDLDWSNVVAAGSSVVTALLPVPEEHDTSKRALREYYHEKLAPASDVDLFLYGLTDEQAIEKITQIERAIRDSILQETTTIRTKNAITIASQYPTRHIQIVLRIYKSVSEILTGFDVDCSCAAYDGKQVYVAPRALAAYMTQINTIDLTRRSPSYENRLSKYSHRGFEVYWPLLDRSRIDPTIFERSFNRTMGLARLLVLEKLPKPSEREQYLNQRRAERGRPPAKTNYRQLRGLTGNIKDNYEDEVAEWVEQDDVSDYHTFTIPYGPKFHAKKIEKLLYTKDLLLNAEWNKPKDREVNLHRHPAFFGFVEHVIHDCCGHCPKPSTPEEEEVAEEESKIYVSGDISFLTDNPGRQAIGSFNPITSDDWTEMAYVGNTTRLCQAIVDGDLEHVQDWCEQEGADVNRRDYTGRTPLQLAVISSTPEIVKCLVDHGARMVARMVDGKTALHLAAQKGQVEMVRIMLERSEANEEEEAEKEEARKAARIAAKGEEKEADTEMEDAKSEEEKEDSDESMVDVEEEDEDEDMDRTTEGSFVKVGRKDDKKTEDAALEETEEGPDVFDVNVLAWDVPASPLHFAIVNGHTEVVKLLVSTFGADVMLPVKLVNDYQGTPKAAILTLVLTLSLPLDKAKEMTATLLKLGASSAQADLKQATALHYFASHPTDLFETLLLEDEPAAKRALNHLMIGNSQYNPDPQSPLMIAILAGNTIGALKLLNLGAKATIEFADFVKSFTAAFEHDRYFSQSQTTERSKQIFHEHVTQPLFMAIEHEAPEVAIEMLERGADPNTMNLAGQQFVHGNNRWRTEQAKTALDVIREQLNRLRDYNGESSSYNPKPWELMFDDYYLGPFTEGTYAYFNANNQLEAAKESYKRLVEQHEKSLEEAKERKGLEEKKQAVKEFIGRVEKVEEALLAKGAKTFKELHPDPETQRYQQHQQTQTLPSLRPNGNNTDTVKMNKFKIDFNIFGIWDLTDERKAAYVKLYEAAWTGDLATIKSYTLAPWGEENDQTPLNIAVTDTNQLSPFAVAMMKGHKNVAKAIMEIAAVQYAPPQETRQRYSMNPDDEYDSEYEASDDDDDNIRVYGEIIDDQYTFENIGQISTQVKSNTPPTTLLSWNYATMFFIGPEGKAGMDHNISTAIPYRNQAQQMLLGTFGLGRYGGFGHSMFASSGQQDPDLPKSEQGNLFEIAIYKDDLDTLNFLLDLGREFNHKVNDEVSRIYDFPVSSFWYGISLGRTRCLVDIIKKTGASLPLQALIKKAGVVVTEKPKYYQGLSVHGRKREDWAQAGRESQNHARVENQNSPFLRAAYEGCIESVEWFNSDAPARYYNEFAEANKDDKKVKTLAMGRGGVEGAIDNWLGARVDLALHCAVMSKNVTGALKVLQYLLKVNPSSINKKSSQGYTPLFLAFSLRRHEAAKLLIAAGADLSTRDFAGNNLLHALLCGARQQPHENLKEIKPMLDLISKEHLSTLIKERSAKDPGAASPLAQWLHYASKGTSYDYRYSHNYNYAYSIAGINGERIDVLQMYLDATNSEELTLVNGEGDTPLHLAVKYRQPRVAQIFVERKPELLWRENSTGRTPLEMAEDAYLAGELRTAPNFNRRTNGNILERQPQMFTEDHEKREDDGTEKGFYRLLSRLAVWVLEKRDSEATVVAGDDSQAASKTVLGKRKLVSLFEANEVAKRLAAKKGSGNELGYGGRRRQYGRKWVSKKGRAQGEHLPDEEAEEEVGSDEVEMWYQDL